NRREPLRHVARRLRRLPRGVELVRVRPDQPQPLADFLIAQLFEIDAVALAVGELAVVASLAGEVGIDFEGVPDVADDDERRPLVVVRQRPGIVLRLPPRRPRTAGSGRPKMSGLSSNRAFGPPGSRLCLASRMKWPRL